MTPNEGATLYTLWFDIGVSYLQPMGLEAGGNGDTVYLYPVGTEEEMTALLSPASELDAEEPSWIVMVGLAPEEQYIVATDGYLYEPIPASEWARLLYRDLWRRPSHF